MLISVLKAGYLSVCSFQKNLTNNKSKKIHLILQAANNPHFKRLIFNDLTIY